LATVVYYNNVELHNVVTRQWNEECVYDSSGTDLLYRKISMRFQGICHKSAYNPGVGGGWGPAYIIAAGVGEGTETTEIFNRIRPLLLMPRQQLRVEMNGKPVLNIAADSRSVQNSSAGNSAAPSGMSADLNNGPTPRVAALTYVVGDQVFRIDFSIECAIDANVSPIDNSPLGAGTLILNNRWGITESTGDNFAITRTITGNMRLATWTMNSQDFRRVVVPPLELSFKRASMSFQVSPNGLDCSYTIVDTQTHIAAPWPACKVEGSYTESTNDGVNFWGDCSVTLEGPLNASVHLLHVRALQIIDTRLNIVDAKLQAVDKVNYSLEAASLTESIGEKNIVQAHIRIKHTKEPAELEQVAELWSKGFGQATGGTERLLDLSKYPALPGQPGAYDVWHSQEPKVFGYLPGTQEPRQTAFLMLLGCYYQDPWHPQKMLDGTFSDNSSVGATPNSAPSVSVTPRSAQSPQPAKHKMSPETMESSYTFTRVDTKYITTVNNVQLPIAATQAKPTDDTSVVVALSPPQVRREIHYDSERIGKHPEIVGSQLTYTDGEGITCTLLKCWDEVRPPDLTADKTQTIYRIRGYRLYAVSRPPTAKDKMRIGVLPNTNKKPEENKVALQDLQSDRMQA
jgi:hypothetical protein